MKKKKIIIGAILTAVVLAMLAAVLVLILHRSEPAGKAPSKDNTQQNSDKPQKEEVKYFEENVVSDGEYEVFTEISLETCAAVYKGTKVLRPVIQATYGAQKDVVPIEDDLLVLSKLGEYTLTFHFSLPDGTEKTVVRSLQVVDKTPPTIVNRFAPRYRYGDMVDLSKSLLIIDAYDNAPKTEYKVYAGDERSENLVSVKNNKFRIASDKKHTVVITSKDSFGNVNEKKCTLYVAGTSELDYFDVETLLGSSCGTISANLEFNNAKKYIKEGTGSLHYKRGGNWTAFGLTEGAKLNWDNYYGLSFWVYNPSKLYDATIQVGGRSSLSSNIAEDTSEGENLIFTLKKNAWTKCVLNEQQLRSIVNNEFPYVTIYMFYVDNGGDVNADRWVDFELYYDQFELQTKPSFYVAEGEILEKYYYGDVVEVPKFQIKLPNGTTASGDAKVYVGDSAISVKNGKFTVRSYEDYRYDVTATVGGIKYTDSFGFSVYDELNTICDWSELLAAGTVTSSYKTVTIQNKKQNALIWKTRDGYFYPCAVLKDSKDIPWRDNKLSFQIYNPTKYDFRLSICATSFSSGGISVSDLYSSTNSQSIKDVVIKSGEVKTVTVYGDEFNYRAYPSLAFSMNAYHNGAYLADKKMVAKEQFLACELQFFDFKLSKGNAPQKKDDDTWAIGTCREARANLSTECVNEGNYSIWWGPTGNYPSLEIRNKVEWSKVSKFTFKVYNPSDQDIKLNVSIGAMAALDEVVAKAGKWTTVTITNCDKFVDGTNLVIGMDYLANGGVGSDSTNALFTYGLYFDSFKLTY